MISVKVRSHCGFCDFKVEWELRTNEHGFFQLPDAHCPNDFSLLIQELDSKDAENEWLSKKIEDKVKKDADKRRS